MAKTKSKEGAQRFVYRFKDGELQNQIITGEAPAGWFDLVREAKLASTVADEGDTKSEVAGVNVAAAKIEIEKIEDVERLEAIIALDTRKGVTDAAQAKLASLEG